MKFHLSEGVGFFLLGRRKTIFVESSQRIFEVDDMTAYLTCLLSESVSARQLEDALVARCASPAAARSSLRSYLLHWSRQGVLDIAIDEDEGQPLHRQVLDLAGTSVSINYYDRSLLDLILPVFNHHESPADGQALIAYDVAPFGDRVCISRNRSGGMIVSAAQAVPVLKALLTDDVLANLGANIALHAALLVKKEKGLLICGAPGAGKTTLALALLEAGFACGGDDIALLNEQGLLRGVPFPPALKQGSWGLLKEMKEAILAAPIHRRLDNRRVRYLAPIRYAPGDWVPLESIVLIHRTREGPVAVSRLEPLCALSELLGGAFTPQRQLALPQFQALLNTVSDARVIELVYSELTEAVDTLSRHYDGQ